MCVPAHCTPDASLRFALATVSNPARARNVGRRPHPRTLGSTPRWKGLFGPGRSGRSKPYVLRNGSMKSRIQSPRMLNDMTVTRIAKPGMELIHQPVER